MTVLQLSDGRELDLLGNIPMSLNYSIADVRDPSKRQASFSKTIKLPGTKNNNTILQHIYDIEVVDGFNPNIKTDVSIIQDGITVMEGFMQLLSIDVEDKQNIYNVSVIGDSGGFFAAIEGRELADLDFSQYDHTFTRDAIVASWGNTPGSSYLYPLIDTGFNNGVTFPIDSFIPSFYVKEYLDKMFEAAGWSFTSNFLDSTYFKTLHILGDNGGKMVESIMKNRYAKITMVVDSIIPSPSGTEVIWDNIEQDTGNNVDASFHYIIPAEGQYQFELFLDTTITTTKTMFVTKIRGGVESTIMPQNHLVSGKIGMQTPVVSLLKNDVIRVLYFSFLGVPSAATIKAGSYLIVKAINGAISADEPMEVNNTVPVNTKQKDFFMSIVKMHNLFVSPDPDNKKNLLIEPRDDYYANPKTVDWTNKRDTSQVLKIRPLGDLLARDYLFKYKEGKDYYNEGYQKLYKGETYGQRKVTIDNEFLVNEVKTEVIFTNTVLVGARAQPVGAIVYPFVYPSISKHPYSTVGTTAIAANIRIMMYNGVRVSPYWDMIDNGVKTATSSVFGNYIYPFSGHIDDVLSTTKDISFGAPRQLAFNTRSYTNNNLYKAHYSKFINEVTDKNSKVVSSRFLLDAADISALDFSAQYLVDNHILRLNKITDYDANKRSLCNVEFIKIKEAAAFTGVTIYSFGGVKKLLENVIPFTPLLDDFPSPIVSYNASRISDSTYIGASMKVRRSSDNEEKDIFLSDGELDQIGLLAHVGDNNGYVVTLYDQSGNGKDATQSDKDKQPRIVLAGVVDKKNGKPAIYFDGVDDYLDCGTINGGTKPANFSAFTVFSFDDLAASRTLFGSIDSAAANTKQYSRIGITPAKMRSGYSDGADFRALDTTTMPLTADTQAVYSHHFTDGDTDMGFFIDGGAAEATALVAGTGTTNTGTESKTSIGRFGEFDGVYFKGYFHEITLYPTDQLSNRTGIRDNMNSFYSTF